MYLDPHSKDDDVSLDGTSVIPYELYTNTAKVYKATTSFSHVLGNLTALIENYLEGMFPPNFFKQKRATTEVAFKDIKDHRKNLLSAEKPYLIIDPKFNYNDESEALPTRMLWDKYNTIDHSNDPFLFMGNHSVLMVPNDDKKFMLGYTFNRYRLEFGITILVDTQMLRLSLMNYLRSNFRFRHYFPIERYTETLIPKAYIEYIAGLYSMDIKSESFLQLLNQMSEFSILRLHRPATDTTEFFVMRYSTLQLKLPDYPSEDRQMSGRIEKYSSVSFTIEMETNIMNNFFIMANDTIENKELMSEYMVKMSIKSRAPVLEPFDVNKTLYTKLTVEFDEINDYTISLIDFLGDDLYPVIEYIMNNNLNDDYISIKAFRWDELIDITDTSLVEFNKSSLTLTLKQLELETVYNIAIYFNMNYIANIKKFIQPTNATSTQI